MEAAANDKEEEAATPPLIPRFLFFCNFIFFGFLFCRAGDISTHTQKSDFHVRVCHPHVKIKIFAGP